MKNLKLLATENDFNEFTEALRELCKKNRTALVKLRNRYWVEVEFTEGDEGQDFPSFDGAEMDLWWYADGSSSKNKDFDIVELR